MQLRSPAGASSTTTAGNQLCNYGSAAILQAGISGHKELPSASCRLHWSDSQSLSSQRRSLRPHWDSNVNQFWSRSQVCKQRTRQQSIIQASSGRLDWKVAAVSQPLADTTSLPLTKRSMLTGLAAFTFCSSSANVATAATEGKRTNLSIEEIKVGTSKVLRLFVALRRSSYQDSLPISGHLVLVVSLRLCKSHEPEPNGGHNSVVGNRCPVWASGVTPFHQKSRAGFFCEPQQHILLRKMYS